jgi:hypothetical protein
MSNEFNFDDDEIRRSIIEKEAKEPQIKQQMEDIEYWYRIESQVIQELDNELKKKKIELRNELKKKKIELRNLYKSNRIAEVNKKYNISTMFNAC